MLNQTEFFQKTNDDEKTTTVNDVNTSIYSNSSKIKVIAPPNVLYKADDSDDVVILDNVETSSIDQEFPESIKEKSDKNETIDQDDFLINEKKSNFDPQIMLEKIRKNNLYPSNITAKRDYELLSCQSQAFLQRISIIGEFF